MFDIIELIEHKHFGSSYTFCCLFIHYLFRVTLITMHYSVISWFSNVSVAPPLPPFVDTPSPNVNTFAPTILLFALNKKKNFRTIALHTLEGFCPLLWGNISRTETVRHCSVPNHDLCAKDLKSSSIIHPGKHNL